MPRNISPSSIEIMIDVTTYYIPVCGTHTLCNVIGREGWKTMIVSKLMYGCGALAWYQRECDDLEVIQNGFGRWIWEVG